MRFNAIIRSIGSVVASMLLLSLFGVGMAFTARDPAIANTAMNAAIDGLAEENAGDGDHIDAPNMPKPVVGAELFVGRSGANSCPNRDAVVGQFLQDENEIGGRVFSMAEGMDQRFSDVWRASVGVEEITISGIVTHMFFDRVSDGWTADVVELDKTDCAISRTLLTGDAFNALLATLAREHERFRAGYEASNETSSPDIRVRANAIP